VASHLGRRGFALHSLSDIVREEAASRGFPPEREHLIRIGNDLRERHGAGVLAERIVARVGSQDVVDSIRNPAEVAVLRRLPRFVLVGVRASTELRFARSLSRARRGDPTTIEEFRMREAQEQNASATGQQLGATFLLADEVIDNEGDVEKLQRAVDALLERLGDHPPV
jgi:dephospho-CoA kinase